MAYTYLGPACGINDIPRDIPERDPPRTYVHTYFVRLDPRFMQSLALMRSANMSVIFMIFCDHMITVDTV